MKIATGGAPADTADIRWHLEGIRHELRPPLGVLDLAEGQAEAEGDAQLADALANLTHRLVETLDAYERAIEALDAVEAIGRERAAPAAWPAFGRARPHDRGSRADRQTRPHCDMRPHGTSEFTDWRIGM